MQEDWESIELKKCLFSSIYLFPPFTQWCSISDVLFTGRRGCQDLVF